MFDELQASRLNHRRPKINSLWQDRGTIISDHKSRVLDKMIVFDGLAVTTAAAADLLLEPRGFLLLLVRTTTFRVTRCGSRLGHFMTVLVLRDWTTLRFGRRNTSFDVVRRGSRHVIFREEAAV